MEQDERDTQDGVGFIVHTLPILFDALLLSRPTSTAMEQDEQDERDKVGFILSILPILFGALLFSRPTSTAMEQDEQDTQDRAGFCRARYSAALRRFPAPRWQRL